MERKQKPIEQKAKETIEQKAKETRARAKAKQNRKNTPDKWRFAKTNQKR